MVDFNMDVGELFKKLFSKKEGDKEDTSSSSLEKIRSKTPILIAGAVGIILIVFIIYFFIFRPKLIEKRELLEKNENYEKELIQLKSELEKQQEHLKNIKKKFSGKFKLFHTNAEVEGLYETISTLALKYKLTVSKLERDKEIPVYKPSNNSDNSKENQKQVEYYKIEVKNQVTGNYLRYMNFKESIASMNKIVNFEKEEIKVMPKKKGVVIADGILSVIRLP